MKKIIISLGILAASLTINAQNYTINLVGKDTIQYVNKIKEFKTVKIGSKLPDSITVEPYLDCYIYSTTIASVKCEMFITTLENGVVSGFSIFPDRLNKHALGAIAEYYNIGGRVDSTNIAKNTFDGYFINIEVTKSGLALHVDNRDLFWETLKEKSLREERKRIKDSLENALKDADKFIKDSVIKSGMKSDF